MTKKCPECGKQVPDEAHFCADCGHDFFQKNSPGSSDSIFSNGKIFLVLIAVAHQIGNPVYHQIEGVARLQYIIRRFHFLKHLQFGIISLCVLLSYDF